MLRLTVNGAEHCLGLDPNTPLPRNRRSHIVPGTQAPAGVGEPATPVMAKAIFAATDQRLGRLPLKIA